MHTHELVYESGVYNVTLITGYRLGVPDGHVGKLVPFGSHSNDSQPYVVIMDVATGAKRVIPWHAIMEVQTKGSDA